MVAGRSSKGIAVELITREIRLLFWAILGVIVPFGLLLYLVPGSTGRYWAWEISVSQSAILIGAGYLGAVVYYVLALRRNDWLQVRNGMGGLVLFSSVLLVATALHWEQFRSYHITTLVWLAFYYGGVVLVPIFYRTQPPASARIDVSAAETGPLLADGWRTWLAVRGFLYLGLAFGLLIWAGSATGAWPWPIGELEVRVFAGQIAVVGWNAVVVVQQRRRWGDHVLGLILTGVIGVLQLIGLAVTAGSYEWSAELSVVLVLMFAEWVATPALLMRRYGLGDGSRRPPGPVRPDADRAQDVARFGFLFIAITYLVLGVLGFAGFDVLNPFQDAGVGARYLLNLIAVNGLHNVVHVGIGVTGLVLLRVASRTWALVAGAALLVLFVAGIIQAAVDGLPRDQMFLGLVPLNAPGHILHVVTGSLLLYLGLSWREDARVAPSA